MSNNKNTRRKKGNSQFRVGIFAFIAVLGLISAVSLYFSEMKDKKVEDSNQPIVLNNAKEKDTSSFSKQFTRYGQFNLPSNFEESSITEKDGQFLIYSADETDRLAHIDNVKLTTEEEEVYKFNNMKFYARILKNKVYPAIKVENNNDYINLDEFHNENSTFFALAYDEVDHYKYAVINVYNGEDGHKHASYTIIQLSKQNKEVYSDATVDENYHRAVVSEIFSSFKR